MDGRDPAWRALTDHEVVAYRDELSGGVSWPFAAAPDYYWRNACSPLLTMTDYYDGPRGGITLFDGHPHHYASEFADFVEDGTTFDNFMLRPIDDEVLALALEDRAIWRRWEDVYDSGDTTHEDQPALPADRPRHDEIGAALESRLPPSSPGTRCRGEFLVASAPARRHRVGLMRVRWREGSR